MPYKCKHNGSLNIFMVLIMDGARAYQAENQSWEQSGGKQKEERTEEAEQAEEQAGGGCKGRMGNRLS